MKIIGIDYGNKRVGVAISDISGKLAFPLSVLENNDKLLEKIQVVIKNEEVKKIVVGESKKFSGEPNKIMKDIEVFVEKLKKDTPLEVVLEPEFLSSHQAEYFQGKTEMHDASAAAIILQSYLDRNLE